MCASLDYCALTKQTLLVSKYGLARGHRPGKRSALSVLLEYTLMCPDIVTSAIHVILKMRGLLCLANECRQLALSYYGRSRYGSLFLQ